MVDVLRAAMREAVDVAIAVSFVRISGLQLLLPALVVTAPGTGPHRDEHPPTHPPSATRAVEEAPAGPTSGDVRGSLVAAMEQSTPHLSTIVYGGARGHDQRAGGAPTEFIAARPVLILAPDPRVTSHR